MVGGGGVVKREREKRERDKEKKRQEQPVGRNRRKAQQQKGGKCKKEKGTKASHRVSQFYSDGHLTLGGQRSLDKGSKGTSQTDLLSV